LFFGVHSQIGFIEKIIFYLVIYVKLTGLLYSSISIEIASRSRCW